MKVRELQEKLSRLDQDAEIVFYTEDESFLTAERAFVLFDFLGVDSANVERTRLDDGTPYMKFDPSSTGERVCLVEITSAF